MFKKLSSLVLLSMMIASCKTLDLEKDIEMSLQAENKSLKSEISELKQALEIKEVEDEILYDIEPVVIRSTKYVVVSEKDIEKKKNLTGSEAAYASMKDSLMPLEEYVGGTSLFDYDENRQYPVFTKQLALTTILLNSDEYMPEGSTPYMSDTTRWEVTGDVWETDKETRQLIMIKPKQSGLETNMMIVTNKRLYHFVLYSTSNTYQPMVRFRYPHERSFKVANTKKVKGVEVVEELDEINLETTSFNYTISIPKGQKKIDWIPKRVYDDGSHTYILLPEVVLQKEYPGVWENGKDLVNYEIDEKKHNLIIINKLINKVTLRIGNSKVIIKKKKGESRLNIKR